MTSLYRIRYLEGQIFLIIKAMKENRLWSKGSSVSRLEIDHWQSAVVLGFWGIIGYFLNFGNLSAISRFQGFLGWSSGIFMVLRFSTISRYILQLQCLQTNFISMCFKIYKHIVFPIESDASLKTSFPNGQAFLQKNKIFYWWLVM